MACVLISLGLTQYDPQRRELRQENKPLILQDQLDEASVDALVKEAQEAFELVVSLSNEENGDYQRDSHRSGHDPSGAALRYNICIDAQEVKLAMRALGFIVRREQVRQLVAEADEGTGQLSYPQFERLVLPRMTLRALDRSTLPHRESDENSNDPNRLGRCVFVVHTS